MEEEGVGKVGEEGKEWVEWGMEEEGGMDQQQR